MSKMKEQENKFFNKLYDDMLINGLISNIDIKNRDDKIKVVISYLEDINSKKDSNLKLLKSFYQKRYIIKEEDIPDSYYAMQIKLAFERGMGITIIDNKQKKEIAKSIILAQIKSLDIWLDYLFSSDLLFYSLELKYWALEGMLKMGSYDNEKQEFRRRSKTTVNMFIDLDKESLALTINEMNKYLKNQEVSDENLAPILATFSFSKLYTYFYNQVKLIKNASNGSDDGIWVKYREGSDYLPLVKSLEGGRTGWCTAAELTAKMQLELGDFYVYYTKDKNGEYKIPRVAIRMENNAIAEIRGVAYDQNVEASLEKVVEEKLEEFYDKDKYIKKVNDMKLMTIIYNKHKKGIDLSKEELIFLYEMYDDIIGFGYSKDPRIYEVKSERNLKKDLSKIFECSESEITDDEKELYKRANEIVCFIGNIDLTDEFVDFPKLSYISGSLRNYKSSTNSKNGNLETLKGLNNVKIIKGNIDLLHLINLEGLNNLEIIGGYADFSNLKQLEGLKKLKKIGSHANFNSLTYLKSLDDLEIIGGNANFDSLIDLYGLNNLQIIGRRANFINLTNLEGLANLKIIDGNANFDMLTNLNGLNNLEKIAGNANFYCLTILEGLNNLQKIGINANFNSLVVLKGMENLQIIVGNANFGRLVILEGLSNLQTIRGNANFNSLNNHEFLKSFKYMITIPKKKKLIKA